MAPHTNWSLPPDAWQHMVGQLKTWPGNRAITDDRKRLAVSAYVWARVTQGENHFSPCPEHIANDLQARRTWRRQRTFICRWLTKTDEHPYYRQLKPLLDDHADQLAQAIDTERSTGQMKR